MVSISEFQKENVVGWLPSPVSSQREQQYEDEDDDTNGSFITQTDEPSGKQHCVQTDGLHTTVSCGITEQEGTQQASRVRTTMVVGELIVEQHTYERDR